MEEKLAGVNSIKANEKLVSCLQDLETIQTETNKNYADEMQELYDSNKYVSKKKEIAISDKYNKILLELLKETAIKYNGNNIKIGVDAFTSNINDVKSKINHMKKAQGNIKNINGTGKNGNK